MPDCTDPPPDLRRGVRILIGVAMIVLVGVLVVILG